MPIIILAILIISSFTAGRFYTAYFKSNIAVETTGKLKPTRSSFPTPNSGLTNTPAHKLSPIPTKSPNKTPSSKNSSSEWLLIKKNEALTLANIPNDERMSTPDELFEAMNNYRITHNLQPLTKDSTLCNVAQKRAEELQKLGNLDNHEGFYNYLEDFVKGGFETMPSEVLYYGGPLLGVHIVEYGWDRSLTGHRDEIQNLIWNRGCAGINSKAVVFIFGRK